MSPFLGAFLAIAAVMALAVFVVGWPGFVDWLEDSFNLSNGATMAIFFAPLIIGGYVMFLFIFSK